jgi:hypothetical protein
MRISPSCCALVRGMSAASTFCGAPPGLRRQGCARHETRIPRAIAALEGLSPAPRAVLLHDHGTLLCSWIEADEAGFGASGTPTTAEGFMSRKQASERYSEFSGLDLANIGYYQIFGAFKI